MEAKQSPLSPLPSASMNLYHRHIISDINRLEDRANKFMGLRVEFIRQKCKPIEERIEELKQQVKHYKLVEATSDQTMEAREDVTKLRDDIAKYQSISKYYQKHVDDLERIHFREENRQLTLQLKLRELQERYRGTKRQDALELRDEMQQSVLPTLEHSQFQSSTPKSAFNQRSVMMKQRRSPHVNSIMITNPTEEEILKLQLRSLLGQFNNNDRLIKDCFEVKKAMVQRMIGQLQSRLVKKKKLFVRVCQAIGRKQFDSVSEEEFKQLDADQIFTLIISFPSFTRKFEAQLQAKRQKTVEITSTLR